MRILVAVPSVVGLLGLGCVAPEPEPPPSHAVAWPTDSAWAVDSAARAAGLCGPTADSLRTPNEARVTAGDYLLTMVATAGSRRGASVRGRLRLRPTSSADRSPRTGEGPAKPDTLHHPLYGGTDVDLSAVGAPIGVGRDNSEEPQPGSLDPIYPGVLAFLWNYEFPDRLRQTSLLVATLSNSRAQGLGIDGAGIALAVRRIDDPDFAGTWDRWGLVSDGAGYFCATRVGIDGETAALSRIPNP